MRAQPLHDGAPPVMREAGHSMGAAVALARADNVVPDRVVAARRRSHWTTFMAEKGQVIRQTARFLPHPFARPLGSDA